METMVPFLSNFSLGSPPGFSAIWQSFDHQPRYPAVDVRASNSLSVLTADDPPRRRSMGVVVRSGPPHLTWQGGGARRRTRSERGAAVVSQHVSPSQEENPADQPGARAQARERAILEVNNAIILKLTQESLLRAISEALFKVVPFDRAAMTLHEPGTDHMRILALTGRLPPKTYPPGVALDRQDSHVGWAFDNQRTLLRRDLETERQFTPEHRLYDEGIRSLCTAPLIFGGKSIGTITVGSTTPRQFTEADETFLRDIANQVALAVANMQAFEEIASLKARLQAENQYLQEEIRGEHNYAEIVGGSVALRDVLRDVEQVAPTDSTVLIMGETGTGKELVARAIHDRSKRKDRPLVKVNCGAISAGLVESELFGHVKGAFTGALANREGRFKLADGGTIFLDEVSELPLEAQVKLLRVLQEQEFEQVGGSKTTKVDVRVIAATNRDLGAEAGAGRFRNDLFYRLNVVPISVPPLRAREGDVELLVQFFVQKLAKKLGRPPMQVPADVMRRLRAYAWPGNVRELQNVIERAIVLAQDDVLAIGAELTSAIPVPAVVAEVPASSPRAPCNTLASGRLVDVERRHIEAVLIERNWMIEGERGAARVLNLHPNTLRGRMRKLGIKRPNAS
jgi:formate hydrogenlyase transcriptional activator